MAMSAWSTTNLSNGSTLGINIAENCPAANVNNALREIMAQTRAAVTTNSLTLGGNASFGGFQAKDLAAATLASDAPRYDQVLPIGGGTATGNIAIQKTSGDAYFSTTSALGTYGLIRHMRTGGLARWDYGATNDAEAGSNAGTNFVIGRYDDAGTFISNAFFISRSTGQVTIYGNLDLVSNSLTWSSLANFSLGYSGTTVSLTADTGDSLQYDRTGNTWSFNIGAIPSLQITGTQVNALMSGGLYPVGPRNYISNPRSSAYTLSDVDRGTMIYCISGAYDITIPTAAAVPEFVAGSHTRIINDGSASKNIVPDVGVTLVWSPTGGTGTRALAVGGIAELIRTTSNRWFISGTGLS